MWQCRHDLRWAGRCHAPYVPPTEGRIFVDLSTGFVWTSHRSEACRLGQAPGFSRGVHDASLRMSSSKENVSILWSLGVHTRMPNVSFGLSNFHVSRLQNFGRPAKRPSSGLPRHPTKQQTDLTWQSTTSPNLSFGLSTRLHLQRV